MDNLLWTSAEAAHAFRVGVSSIKRWTDEGELEAVKTPGGHRRYTVPALYRFASLRNLSTDRLPPVDPVVLEEELPPPADLSLYDALAIGDIVAVRRLVTPNVTRLAQRAAFFDRVVGDALREIGYRWERGELGVDEEHRASHMIAEALDRLRPSHASLNRNGPLAVLACPPGEHHELPLHILRLIFEWSGWQTELHGAHLPWTSAIRAVERVCPAIFAFTSRTASFYEDTEFSDLLRHCEKRGTRVIVGGDWARGGSGGTRRYLRFRTVRGFEKWLRTQ
ncbi:MAG: B12-binding domain-containing protein [Acidobacteria bacterium]|nr:B12-binding domain-containing protein [Acidobacteriota bacterium]